jgi:hypothetical protein
VEMLKMDIQADRLRSDEIEKLLNPDLVITLYGIIDDYLNNMMQMNTVDALAVF